MNTPQETGPQPTGPGIKGWCPGAHRPMMSGDGLIVRVRPHMGRINTEQVLGLCALSQQFGNGIIDLTSRANLQLRGIAQTDHAAVIARLTDLALIDDSAETEARRNIMVTPDWTGGDVTTRLYDLVTTHLHRLPTLPAKVGIAIDTGTAPHLQNASADFRIERTTDGALILRLDGTSRGRVIDETNAVDALSEMAAWFVDTRREGAKRVAQHVANTPPPAAWAAVLAAAPAQQMRPGTYPNGIAWGAAFGSINAGALDHLMRDSGATGMRLTPWRLFLLEDAMATDSADFVATPSDPALNAHACPGAPACSAATVETRALARALAAHYPAGLHVSGCSKGCAHPRVCATTVVGQNGTYDLVEQGHPWDQPRQRGLTATDLLTRKARPDAL